MRTPLPPPDPNQKENLKPSTKIILILILIFVCFIAVVAVLAPPAQRSALPAPPAPAPTTHFYKAISSLQLEAEYRADYNKADREYTGKVLLIHAVVEGWNGSHLSPALNLNEGYMEADFTTTADERWIQTLQRGQRVDIICRADGAESVTFYLRECRRAESKDE